MTNSAGHPPRGGQAGSVLDEPTLALLQRLHDARVWVDPPFEGSGPSLGEFADEFGKLSEAHQAAALENAAGRTPAQLLEQPPKTTTPLKAPEGGPAPELPPGVRSSRLRRRGMELVNQLPEADRECIGQALRELPAGEAGRIVSEIGRLEGRDRSQGAPRRAVRGGTGCGPPEGPAKPVGGLDDSAPAHFDEDELQVFVRRPPPRVSQRVEGVNRSVFKRRMIRDGQAPTWVRNARDWHPHHLIRCRRRTTPSSTRSAPTAAGTTTPPGTVSPSPRGRAYPAPRACPCTR